MNRKRVIFLNSPMGTGKTTTDRTAEQKRDRILVLLGERPERENINP